MLGCFGYELFCVVDWSIRTCDSSPSIINMKSMFGQYNLRVIVFCLSVSSYYLTKKYSHLYRKYLSVSSLKTCILDLFMPMNTKFVLLIEIDKFKFSEKQTLMQTEGIRKILCFSHRFVNVHEYILFSFVLLICKILLTF